MSNLKKHVKRLIKKASKADNSDTALKFAQAAERASSAICILRDIKLK